MTVISYSIVREDVLLLRALNDVSHMEGFYVDVGANDPKIHSVTKLFYDHGWRGINIEASPHWFSRLADQRPRDINIHAAASDVAGSITLFDHPDGGLGTTNETFADRHLTEYAIPKAGIEVDAVRLADVCAAHAPATIHFLKIDVEGHEEQVIRGMNFARFRPWILCVEATEPLRPGVFTHEAWEPLLLEANYHFAFFDGLNRYYVSDEQRHRAARLQMPVDDYVDSGYPAAISQLEQKVQSLETDLAQIARPSGSLGSIGSSVDLGPTYEELGGLVASSDIELHEHIRNVLRLLRPQRAVGQVKGRFGCIGDGGYVHLDDFTGVDTAVSLGIRDDISWDLDVVARGLTVHQFDHTVEDLAPHDDRMVFNKLMIAAEPGDGQTTLAAIVRQLDKGHPRPNIFLKMDIEAAEWSVIEATPPELLARFSQITCEMHGFEYLDRLEWRQGFFRSLRKIAAHYAVIHVHANNFAGWTTIANIPVPNVLEVSFANRGIYQFTDTDELYPGPLDTPCHTREPDMFLGSFRF